MKLVAHDSCQSAVVFLRARDNSYDKCKAPVNLCWDGVIAVPEQNNTQIFTGRMPFLLPNQQCQSTEGKKRHIYTDIKNLQLKISDTCA